MDDIINIAFKQAQYSELLQKHGSVLICDDKIFTGYNHFTICKNSAAIHAEEDVIKRYINWCRTKYYSDLYIRKKLKKAVLITIRVKNNNIRSSAPCRNCIEMIKNYEIKHIIYSDNDNENNSILVSKNIRDVCNRPSSGYRWRERNKAS
jgi:deoxycytidylate deaminase